MKPELINLKNTVTRSVTKKLKKWIEPDTEMFNLFKEEQLQKSKNIKIKKLLLRNNKRINHRFKPLKLKLN
jgi:hypothetical protein